MFRKNIALFVLAGLLSLQMDCSRKGSGDGGNNPPPVQGTNDVDFWLTKSDQSVLLQKQATTLSFGSVNNGYQFIDVDSTQTYQTIDGFGYSLTGGSAYVMSFLSASAKTALLQELFGTGSN
ncbi:MAG: glucosylceramidase, partial [Bacteroidetes bacterium]|nr:glucosylceramidase [Bacteroidota bacterium]